MANSVTFKTVYDAGGGTSLTTINATDKLYWQASGAFNYGAGGAIAVNAWNGGHHIIDASNAELCTTAHPVNLQYVSATEVSIDGGGTVDLNTVTTGQCLNILVDCSPNAEVTAATFWAYGTVETAAPSGLNVYGAKQGESTWTSIAGSALALDLGTSGSAASHNFYVALTVSPTSNGAKTGTLKASITVV